MQVAQLECQENRSGRIEGGGRGSRELIGVVFRSNSRGRHTFQSLEFHGIVSRGKRARNRSCGCLRGSPWLGASVRSPGIWNCPSTGSGAESK